MPPIKILYLIDALTPGGTEKQLILLAESLPRDAFDPRIGVLQRTGYQEGLRLKTPVVDFRFGGPFLVKNLSLIWKLRRYLRRHRFDIVQTQLIEASIYGSLAARLSSPRPLLVGTRRNLYYWVQDQPRAFRLYRFTSRWSDRILINSRSIVEDCGHLERIPHEKISFIPNGVQVEKFTARSREWCRTKHRLPLEAPVVGVVANWRPVKGLVSFLRAAARIREEVPGAHFVLLGQGPQKEELVALSRELGIRRCVHFLSEGASVPEVLPAFDVAVQSSLSESFSNVLIEYMAAEKPIVATRVGEAVRVIEDGRDGLLVEPGRPEEFSRAVVSLLGDRRRAAALGRRAGQKVRDNWSFEKILDRYQSFYRQLLDGRQDRNGHGRNGG